MERRLYGQPHEAGDLANWDAARQVLREGAAPKVTLYIPEYSTKRKLFGGRRHIADKRAIGTGWILGDLKWSWNDGGPYGGSDFDNKPHLSGLLDGDPKSYDQYDRNGGMLRVRKDDEGDYLTAPRGGAHGRLYDLDLASDSCRRLAGLD